MSLTPPSTDRPGMPATPGFRDPEDYARLRALLASTGYSQQGLPQALGVRSIEALRTLPRPTLAALTSGNRPIDVLARLFLMFEPVSTEALMRAIAPMNVQAWADAGLIEIQGFYAQAAMGLSFFEGLVLLHDVRDSVGPTYVMGVAGTTASLAYQAIFRPGALALDLGCGCGVLALLAARTSQRVLATDINPRAVAVTRFNARLNGLDNVEVRAGDLFEPAKAYLSELGHDPERGVGGFDAIYCNPPFVMTPTPGYLYRDSGRPGDGIVEAVARGSTPLLSSDGIAQLVGNWAHLAGANAPERIASWVQGSGCDCLAFTTKTIAPIDYASLWIEETEKSASPEQRWGMLREWLANFERLGIRAISYGAITLRRLGMASSGGARRAPFLAFEDVPEILPGPVGSHVAEMLACRAYLADLPPGPSGDAALADAKLWWSPYLRVDQTLRTPGATAGAGWKPEMIQVRLTRGYPIARQLDQRQLEFVLALDGTRSLREVVESIAQSAKAPPAALLPVCLKLARQMLERAYVLPPGVERGVG